MSTIYRVTQPDGSVVFTDAPTGTGSVSVATPGRPEPKEREHKDNVALINAAKKHIPKLPDYLEYLSYLRSNHPYRLDHVLDELKRTDPQTWLKLQKYPQFRPLHHSTFGLKAADKHLSAGVQVLARGDLTGSAEKWLETTVRDMMKRDRFGPYADVLGSKASTLPAGKAPSYSRSYLGQHMKVEDVRAAKAADAAAKGMAAGRAAVRGAASTALSRATGPVLQVGTELLRPEIAEGVGQGQLRERARTLERKGVIDLDQYLELEALFSQQRYVEMKQRMDEWTAKYLRGR